MDHREPSPDQSLIGHTRNDILQTLQHQSRTDLNDSHFRFIPRGALFRILTIERVRKCVESISHPGNINSKRLDSITNYICHDCHCQDLTCTGARVIFVSLLLIGRESIIESFSALENSRVCDKDLPFQEETFDSTRLPEAFQALSPIEKELFRHFQWQMKSPYFMLLAADEGYRTLDAEVALPWIHLKQVTNNSDPMEGEYSYVQRIEIDGSHHRFVCIAHFNLH